MLNDRQDAYGHVYFDVLKMGDALRDGKLAGEIIERDDGDISANGNVKYYFSDYKDWIPVERKAMRYARGSVLDIGCGAGRVSLYLQGKGLKVIGIDNSPLAIEVCKLRGLTNAKVVPSNEVDSKLGIFDTIVMLGANFGLAGSFEGTKRLLRQLGKITSEQGRIIGHSRDIYQTNDPAHLSYHKDNRGKGRMGGQIKLRVRYKTYASPWRDLLFVSKEEMGNLLDGTGWKVNKYIEETGNPNYVAIIDKVRK
jgi:SAM-dependent methyltransferase